jgi:hypothetical protein
MTYDDFLGNFSPEPGHLYKASPLGNGHRPVYPGENAAQSYLFPEVLVGEGQTSGSIWDVLEGNIRLPEGTLINGQAPGAANETSRWSMRVLSENYLAAATKILAVGRRDMRAAMTG